MVPSFAASPPDLTDLRGRHCLPSAPASSRHLPLGVENQEGLLYECVKQRPAGLPGRKSGPWLYTRPLGAGIKERSLGPSVTLSSAPSFLTPKLSPLPPREPTISEGPKGRVGPICPSTNCSTLPSLGQSHFPFQPSSDISSCPAQPPTPAHPAEHTVLGRTGRGRGCRREEAESKLGSTASLKSHNDLYQIPTLFAHSNYLQ